MRRNTTNVVLKLFLEVAELNGLDTSWEASSPTVRYNRLFQDWQWEAEGDDCWLRLTEDGECVIRTGERVIFDIERKSLALKIPRIRRALEEAGLQVPEEVMDEA